MRENEREIAGEQVQEVDRERRQWQVQKKPAELRGME